MKGLLIKDFMLLKRQKTTCAMILLFAVILVINDSMPFAGALGYITFFCTFLAIGSVSYDEYNNGYAFLFTLPVTVKTYVLEKYLFVLMATASGCLFSGCLAIFCGHGDFGAWWDMISFAAGFGSALLLITAFMMPLQFKFGVEQSRIMGIVLGGLIGGAGWLAFTYADVFFPRAQAFFHSVSGQMGEAGGILCWVGFTVICYLLSVALSVRIMERKDF